MKPVLALGLALVCSAPVAQAEGKLELVHFVCDAVYLPARSTWTRQVDIGFDRQRVRTVQIDGLPVYSFAIAGTTILTALDNERIQIDTRALSWSSDFRGLASAQGRCERRP